MFNNTQNSLHVRSNLISIFPFPPAVEYTIELHVQNICALQSVYILRINNSNISSNCVKSIRNEVVLQLTTFHSFS